MYLHVYGETSSPSSIDSSFAAKYIPTRENISLNLSTPTLFNNLVDSAYEVSRHLRVVG